MIPWSWEVEHLALNDFNVHPGKFSSIFVAYKRSETWWGGKKRRQIQTESERSEKERVRKEIIEHYSLLV